MSKHLACLVILIIGSHTTSLHAMFAAHVRITPENQEKENFKVLIGTRPGKKDFYQVDIVYRDFGTKTYQLVLTDREVAPIAQDFRNKLAFPDMKTTSYTILNHTTLAPTTINWINATLHKQKEDTRSISLTVSAEQSDKTYVMVDFPGGSMVSDGGYYYTIDLPAFIRAYKDPTDILKNP